jgi:hypothetical protein
MKILLFLFFSRLNLDDWAIYLSKQKRDRYQIDLLNDYICIISGGAFEIKLCFNDLIENTPMVKIIFFKFFYLFSFRMIH